MRKYPEKNKIGLFRKLRTDDWLVNHYSGGKPYLDGQLIVRSTVVNPIYSYGYNYEKFGKEFSLFMWTDEDDVNKVSKHFRAAVDSLKENDLNIDESDRFTYLDFDYKGKE